MERVDCSCPIGLHPVKLAKSVAEKSIVAIEDTYKCPPYYDDPWAPKRAFKNIDSSKEWGTYQNCTDVTLYACDETESVARIKFAIWNGDNMYGERTHLRWSCEFEIKDPDFLLSFTNAVDNAFDRHLDREFDVYLEEQRNQWKAQRQDSLLGSNDSDLDDPLAQRSQCSQNSQVKVLQP